MVMEMLEAVPIMVMIVAIAEGSGSGFTGELLQISTYFSLSVMT